MRAIFLTLLAGALSLGSALAGPDKVRDYDVCITLVENAPEEAVRGAGEWARFGGGAAARHCYALALIAIGAPTRAVEELLALAAEEPDLSDEARADVLVQAGEMLLNIGDTGSAGMAATEALRLQPRSANALSLRGATRIATGDVSGGIGDFDRALAENRRQPRLLVRRAAARRLQGQIIAARDDAAFATEIDPGDPAAWLERGRAEAALGDKPAARGSFLEAIALDRDGEIGRSAQVALQSMEAGLE